MSIRVALNHRTSYHYDRLVTLGPHVVRLRPAPHGRTNILSYSLRVEPQPHFLNWQQDPYNNYLARIVFPEPTRMFRVEVDLIADLRVINPFDFFLEESAEVFPFAYEPNVARELVPYLERDDTSPKLAELARSLMREKLRTVDFLVAVNRAVHERVWYLVRMEPGVQSCEETLTLRSGSCRDSGWLLVQLLRHLGLAARFVSGYLIQLKADQPSLDGPSGPAADFTDLHAWAEVYLPGAGWVGLDPTSGLLAGEGHIPLAAVADPVMGAPIAGTYSWRRNPERGVDDRLGETFDYEMSVQRLVEDPRVTLPYDERQWADIKSLGHAIDQKLTEGDVRLSMGGEPTFIALDDPDGDEWNTAALGPTKRKLSERLLKRLREQYAPGSLVQLAQGKWYPGESLPRWALNCYWRSDGVPLWNDPTLLAFEEADLGATPELAERFVRSLAARLGVDPSCAIPAYEDAWYFLWKEQRLPTNVTTQDNRLDDPEERTRLARAFERGLGTAVGFILPLQPQARPQWRSDRWDIRRSQIFLLPGDSPVGLRLPMATLPWLAPEQRDAALEVDPFAARPALPGRVELQHAQRPDTASGSSSPPAFTSRGMRRSTAAAAAPRPVVSAEEGEDSEEAEEPSSSVRTALCVEPRDGRLCIFLPPIRRIDHYLDLISTIEATAAELKLPVMLEGYPPPRDPRIESFSITPDPGVIEVNVPPAHAWDELVEQTETLYEEARQARLTSEKFLMDGRHTGTGGGNHVVLGSRSAADSPFLRRPDLLRSMIGYWQNHPSLSYLFSGMFVGPHSQAPRLDEARQDALYEMEIAFRQIPDDGECPPWLVDRVFRHLLADVTGNTHRAEFCIDKLFSPDSPGGRRGLLEMRGFEMPPHPRMSLAQRLLIRGLIARFWEAPYNEPLIYWGTRLHDRFLLPHAIWQDFTEVVADLCRHGFPFQAGWYAPHLEFRFPRLGETTVEGIGLELRQAIEPWLALGEEASASGTARYVDSSVERIQVLVRGLTEPRHVVTCNGRRLPLHPAGAAGEFVAGVRFRAWQPPSCLHPTLPVNSPLVLDVIDVGNGRSLGGCTYHVSHPGGRAFETLPINANEAESRRHARFSPFGHTPGARGPGVPESNPLFPMTLDLRRPAPTM